MKWSMQREHIVTAFLNQNHTTIRSLYASLNKHGQRTPLGSIYRTMRVLCAMGFAQFRNFGDETLYDNIWVKGEHDHLICTHCGHIVEFDNPAIERLREKVLVANGFSVTTRNFELYEICAACRDAMVPSLSNNPAAGGLTLVNRNVNLAKEGRMPHSRR